MTGIEEHVIRTLSELCCGKISGAVKLNAVDCATLLALYDADPGYVQWQSPVGAAVRLSRMLTDDDHVAHVRRMVCLMALTKAAARPTAMLYCEAEMAGDLLCLLDVDAREKARGRLP